MMYQHNRKLLHLNFFDKNKLYDQHDLLVKNMYGISILHLVPYYNHSISKF